MQTRLKNVPVSELIRLMSLASEDEDTTIRSHPEVMGGDDCIRNTRIPVWLLVSARQQGQMDAQILESYPSLSSLDLAAAWEHFAHHAGCVLEQRTRHKEED